MQPGVILSTERLYLREFTFRDTSFIIELVNSPGWLEFIGDRSIHSDEDAKAYLVNGPMKSYREHGYGLSMVVRKTDNVPVGMCGLLHRESLPHPDIGFAFLPKYSGQGYAFEISESLLAHARKVWNVKTVAAITLQNNTRSIRLLEKLGFTFKHTMRLSPDKEELMLFEAQAIDV